MVKLKENTFLQEDGQINTENWLARLSTIFPPHYIEPISQGIDFLWLIHDKLQNSELLITSLSMAEILVDLQTDPETIVASLFCSYVQTEQLTLDDISAKLGTVIPKLIAGTLRMDAIHYNASVDHKEQQQSLDNLRKMMLAIIDDVRVVLIKLAEQTALIREAQTSTPVKSSPLAKPASAKKDEEHTERRAGMYTRVHEDSSTGATKSFKAEVGLCKGSDKQLALDVMYIYAPLASRLGIGQLKWELEDLAFRQLHSHDYKEIAKSLDSRRIDREQYVEQVMQELRLALQSAGLEDFEMMGRAKHIYSIYRKMKRKDVDFSHIYDVIAIRVLTTTVHEAYTALSTVHSIWQQIPAEFDDYISKPKPNGYRSIHTAVVGPQNKNIEVQVRTRQMHEESELGIAAHWKYKEGAETELHFEKKIAWLRQVIEWQRDIANHETGITNADIHALFDDRVYVFTPAGEVIDLPKGSTPLDFAYAIHSQIGHRCRGAKVNGNIVPLTYAMNTGECIEILTAKHPGPSRDWLNTSTGYIHTDKARSRISHWFKQLDVAQHIQEGRAALERELKHRHLGQIDLNKLARKMHCKTTDDLCLGIGRAEIRLSNVMQHAQTLSTQIIQPDAPVVAKPLPMSETISTGTAAVQGVSGIMTMTAKCCKPVPGDSVIGYITRGRGITIHRIDCKNLIQLPNRDRLIEVDWQQQKKENYPVDILLKAHDHTDLLKDISGLLSTEKIRMLKLNTVPAQQNVLIYFSIEISDHALLQRIMDKLTHLPGVMLVQRVSG
ncbi:MAG: bifunctional (p)ppGpp synthetase/guanosine-3',5'-bis(diphosphate) 3'-pyrophosphohydrolase [Legionellales bacterium]|nr:bifunctional (p)ppGpp synthetase/guanosine-3',5'-bis(diphosphate) 3'-pyrophosphohydrolase [Legionellales bacterium]